MAQSNHTSILYYDLAPDAEARRALEETFVAYADMLAMLDELAGEKAGANLVTLHELAYETVRERTGLPARMVTLGLRDFAANRGQQANAERLPLDDKLFAIKGPSDLTVATVRGRVAIPYDVAGYSPGTLNIFAAQLVAQKGGYQIHIGVTTHSDRTEKKMMTNEGILSRMGRLIAGLANAAVDKAEGSNKIVIVEQALREIDAAAEEARSDIGQARAEEYRILSRRDEIGADLEKLDEKISTAISAAREDLAKAGVARQIDLESQLAALDKALAGARTDLEEGQQALQAVLATRREAEARLADLKRSIAQFPESKVSGLAKPGPVDGAARAAAAVSRATGVPGGEHGNSAELDELDRLHRDRAIEARLAALKAKQH
ncbi:PspA/IM30 family protein [Ensifer adhaerens]|uniref:PspA/IM30 family protein n=1 Tax=Ensifer adhaerens TaxID=106592 RepID=UPI001C4E2CFA|nr:PspA/IM30 family protein [Ensifer adhaerens]MBW0367517.1 PspA/IM30 family protein [Ensifer adhaerens]UCM19457.1 PspA/IM30 family protein [Ensifer adhaerens]